MCSRSTYCRIMSLCNAFSSVATVERRGVRKEHNREKRKLLHLKWGYILHASFQVASSWTKQCKAKFYARGREASPSTTIFCLGCQSNKNRNEAGADLWVFSEVRGKFTPHYDGLCSNAVSLVSYLCCSTVARPPFSFTYMMRSYAPGFHSRSPSPLWSYHWFKVNNACVRQKGHCMKKCSSRSVLQALAYAMCSTRIVSRSVVWSVSLIFALKYICSSSNKLHTDQARGVGSWPSHYRSTLNTKATTV